MIKCKQSPCNPTPLHCPLSSPYLFSPRIRGLQFHALFDVFLAPTTIFEQAVFHSLTFLSLHIWSPSPGFYDAQTEGSFYWADCVTPSGGFADWNWNLTQPDNSNGNEDCAALLGENEPGYYADFSCGMEMKYICEKVQEDKSKHILPFFGLLWPTAFSHLFMGHCILLYFVAHCSVEVGPLQCWSYEEVLGLPERFSCH